MTTEWTTAVKGAGAYADVNGINLYYETHGAGRPLLLLHDGLGSGEMFGPILPTLAERHQVIAVDLQGHGCTADIDRPIDVKLMADDFAALIDHLGLEKPDLVGPALESGLSLHGAPRSASDGKMRKTDPAKSESDDEIPDEIDLSRGVRGKYYEWAKRAKGRFVIVSDEEDRQRQAASARDGTPPRSKDTKDRS